MTDFPENDVIILRDYVPSDLQDVLGGMREQLAPTPSANCSPQPLRTPGSRRAVEPELTVEVLARLERISDRADPPPWTSWVEGRDHASGDSFIQAGTNDDRAEDIYVSRDSGPASPADLDMTR